MLVLEKHYILENYSVDWILISSTHFKIHYFLKELRNQLSNSGFID